MTKSKWTKEQLEAMAEKAPEMNWYVKSYTIGIKEKEMNTMKAAEALKLSNTEFVQNSSGDKFKIKDGLWYWHEGVDPLDTQWLFDEEIWLPVIIEVDQELEDAKKKFPVGSWVISKEYGSTIYKVLDVYRYGEYKIRVVSDCNTTLFAEHCTPFTFPTDTKYKWHLCSSEKQPETTGIKLLTKSLNDTDPIIAFQSYLGGKWRVHANGWALDLSYHPNAMWCEIPKYEED
jgi:hypothetical protein